MSPQPTVQSPELRFRRSDSGQEALAKQLGDLQNQLLAETEIGRRLKESAGELEAAAKELQELGSNLTREKLLDLLIAAPNEARLKAYVSLARNGMDYVFFQTLSEKIDKAVRRGKEEAGNPFARGPWTSSTTSTSRWKPGTSRRSL